MLGERIKRLRLGAKVSQQTLADAVGVERQAVTQWEAGSTSPTPSNVAKIAKFFDLDPVERLALWEDRGAVVTP